MRGIKTTYGITVLNSFLKCRRRRFYQPKRPFKEGEGGTNECIGDSNYEEG